MAYYDRLQRAASGIERGLPTYPPSEFDDMVRREKPTTVIVTSMDSTHADYVVRALDLGCTVVCEKPLTTDADGCRRIVEAAERTGGEVIVTFNYRYSPRNSAVKTLLSSGAIGRVTSVHFEWALDTVHGADYFRRWHREKVNSGGLLVHKSSHHFDLVNWWLADIPDVVYARGALAFYGADNAAARGLGERPERAHGAAGLGTDPFLLDLEADPRLRELYLEAEGQDGYLRDRDVFSAGITIEDNLAVLVEYRHGALLTYSLNAHAPFERYRVVINGTEGRLELEVCERPMVSPPAGGIAAAVDPMTLIESADTGAESAAPRSTPGAVADPAAFDPGDVDPGADGTGAGDPGADGTGAGDGGVAAPDAGTRTRGETLTVQRHWEPAREVDIMALAEADPIRPPRGGAHGGGDLLLLDDVLLGRRSVGPDPLLRAADFHDGVLSVLVGVAANRSLLTGSPVRLDELGAGL
jgi:predicted dehydrogenase